MAEQETLKTETKLNLNAIKKSDKYVVRILDNASQVALYKFKPETQAWEKTEVEGAFFVYLRSSHPKNAFFIMNRLNMNNTMEPVTGDMEFKLQEPFLLYRNKTRDIFGIWFYDVNECRRLGALLSTLCKESQDKGPIPAPNMPSSQEVPMQQPSEDPPAGGKVDIMSLFARAQERYDKQKESAPLENPTSVANSPQAPAVHQTQEHQREQEKFLQQNQQQLHHLQQLLQGKSPSQTKQRANSSPAQYIASRDQRSVGASRGPDHVPYPMENNVTGAGRSAFKLPLNTEDRSTMIESSTSNTKLPTHRKLFQHDKPEAGSPVVHNTANLQPQDSPKRPTDQSGAASTSLLSPMAFQTSVPPPPQAPRQPQPRKLDISPLTQDQLAQALAYLLKNDSEFVSKIHKAYVDSLQEMLPT